MSVTGVLLAALNGCSGKPASFTDSYLAALEQYQGAPVKVVWLEQFEQSYADFSPEALPPALERLYAPDFFFNDTLRSVRDRQTLVTYMQHTARRLDTMELRILGRQIDGRDAWLRWTMHTQFSAGWRDVDTTTIGMTHLRFNEDGQVVLHQDFWDSRQGIFEHLPLLGGIIDRIRRGL